jgi:hypothetical protein
MNVQDAFLKTRTERAIALQEQGMFIVDQRNELPLPSLNLHYSRQQDEQGRFYDYETDWGLFGVDPETRSILVLRKGNPPSELLPQPKLALVTGTVHSGYVSIHNNGSSFELDLQTRDRTDYGLLRTLNETLKAESIPVVVWQLDEDKSEKTPVIRIANDSAMLFASTAIWDDDEQQLVAAHVVTAHTDLLKAVKATLAKNGGKDFLTVKAPEADAFLRGARRGFISVNNNLTAANAEGTVTALLHPLSGDPQANTAEHFYLVVSPEEKLPEKFAERLDLAIPWPIRAEWADYLLEGGQEAGLVHVLPGSGEDFTAGLRVEKNESKWAQVIANGLKQERIALD